MVTGWFEIAAKLTEAEKVNPRNEQGETWLSVFSKETKNNQNMLRRMQRSKDFIDNNFEGDDLRKLARMPMSYIDILSRAHYVDKDASIALSKELLKTDNLLNYRSLLKKYEKIKSSDINIINSRTPHKSSVFYFKRKCFEMALNGGMDNIYSHLLPYRRSLKFRIWKGGHDFVSPHMTCRLDADEASKGKGIGELYSIDAFECFTQYDDEPSDIPRDRILSAITEATFFTRLWIMLPIEGGDRYERMMHKLGPTNVGVVRVDLDSSICHCTLSPKQAPMPDRRHMWSDHELRYIA